MQGETPWCACCGRAAKLCIVKSKDQFVESKYVCEDPDSGRLESASIVERSFGVGVRGRIQATGKPESWSADGRHQARHFGRHMVDGQIVRTESACRVVDSAFGCIRRSKVDFE